MKLNDFVENFNILEYLKVANRIFQIKKEYIKDVITLLDHTQTIIQKVLSQKKMEDMPENVNEFRKYGRITSILNTSLEFSGLTSCYNIFIRFIRIKHMSPSEFDKKEIVNFKKLIEEYISENENSDKIKVSGNSSLSSLIRKIKDMESVLINSPHITQSTQDGIQLECEIGISQLEEEMRQMSHLVLKIKPLFE